MWKVRAGFVPARQERLGSFRFGTARLGGAGQGWKGVVCLGSAWIAPVRCGSVRYGRSGMVGQGREGTGAVR